MAANGWGEGAWGDDGWGGLGNANITPSAATASGSLGSESISGGAPVDATGSSASVSVGQVQSFQSALAQPSGFYNQVHLGSVLPKIPIDVSVTGVSGTVESLTGWGDGAWGDLVWGGGVFADVGQVLPVSSPTIFGALGEKTFFETKADAQLSTSQSKFGVSSLKLDGSGDRIQSTGITLGTDSYTWETFAYFNNFSSTQCIWDAGENVGASQNPVVYITSTNLQLSYAGGTYINAAHGMSSGQWHHIAIVRDGTQLEAFIDGTSIGTATYALGAGSTDHVLGGNFAGTFTMDGFLDESRLTKRVIYTGNFTPPTQALTPNANDIWLLHYDGANGSTSIENSAPGIVNLTLTGTANIEPTSATGNTLLESVLPGAGAIVTEDAITGSVSLGEESISGTANIFPTGVSGTMQLGDESIETDTGAPVTNVPGMTSSLGEESVVIDVTPTITGTSCTGSVGSSTLTGTAVVELTGIELTASIGTALVWGQITPDPGTSWSAIAA